MNRVNLHIHTTASDGLYKPIEILKKAKEVGLEIIAITDHDNINGVREALDIKENSEIEIITGVELTASYPTGQCHILGYGIDLDYIDKFSEAITLNRIENAKKIISFLNEDGFDISVDEVLAVTPNKIIGRRNIATILKKKGYFTTEDEAIEKILGRGQKYYIETKKKTIQECLSSIKESNGLSVLAHPWTLNMTLSELSIFVRKLKEEGLDGIEVFNHNISNDVCNSLIELAKELDLYITCGTDYHGHKKLTELVVRENINCEKILKKLRRSCNGGTKRDTN